MSGEPASKERRKTVGLRESRPAAIDPVLLTRRPAPRGKPTVVAVVGVQFRAAGGVYDFDSGDAHFAHGDSVVVETDRGPAVGTVARATERRVQPADGMLRVLRPTDDNDVRARRRHEEREETAFRTCLETMRERGLKMKLVRAEYAHSGSKIVFYFVADDRVDFRELVRALSERLHVRVEMRQLGIRDQSKLVGGIGSCGRELCCSTWLREFKPITIKMAKDQNLALNPQKVSGQCGRLKCCLSYEEETYRTMRKGMPKVGRSVVTPAGDGRVREVDVLRGLVRVVLESGTETFSVDQVARPGDAPPAPFRPPRPEQAQEVRPTPAPASPAPTEEEDAGTTDGEAPRRRRGRRRGSEPAQETESGEAQRERAQRHARSESTPKQEPDPASGPRRRRRRKRSPRGGGDSETG